MSAAIAPMEIPACSRRPVITASCHRSSAVRSRRSVSSGAPAATRDDVLVGGRHVLPALPPPASSGRPGRTRATRRRSSTSGCGATRGRAAPRSRSRTAGSPAASRRAIAASYISAASSSGACDQSARAIVLAQRRVRIELEHVEREVLRPEADGGLHRLEPLAPPSAPGSHIIRSRLRLSKPAARAPSTAAARLRHVVDAARAAAVPSRRNDCTPRLSRLTPASRNARERRRRSTDLRVRLERHLGAGRDVEGLAAGRQDRRHLAGARAATACRRRRRSCRPARRAAASRAAPAPTGSRRRPRRRSAASGPRRRGRG